jgi:putative FmdB family regulatory protein
MPVYDFRCPQCGQIFELTRPRSEAGDPAHCPNDGTLGERIWTSIAIPRGAPEPGKSDADDPLAGLDMGGMDTHAGHMH